MTAHDRKAAAAPRLHGNLIGGRDVESQEAATLRVFSPSDGAVIAHIQQSGERDIEAAVSAARSAFDGAWGRLTGTERGRLLTRLADAIAAEAESLGALESLDTGKPIGQGRADAVAAARYFEFYGTAADKLHGDTIPFLNGYTVAVTREPLGVTGHIVPWNYPLQIFGRSVAASLACGNACVVKPAEDASLSVLRVAQMARDIGFPDGVLNVVTGLGAEAGAALAAHPDVDFISFTGSPEVGALVQQAAARHHAGVTLELGGKSPQLVFADADLDAAIPVLVKAIIQNGGQTCSAGSRALIARPIFDRVVDGLANRFAALRAGPHDRDLDLGAMINEKQQRRVNAFVAGAAQDGASILAEGAIVEDAPRAGFYVQPTLIAPSRNARIAREEVFGPVLSVMPFDDEADAIALANGTDYGLVAGIWTNDAKRSMRVARAMRCGQVFVNGYGAGGGIELPFGGVKKSGHGREKGFEALYEFSAAKTIVINHG